MTAALLRFSKKLHKKLEKSLASDLKVTFEVEDAEDTDGNPSGSTALMIDIEKDGGWGGSNNVFINGYVGVSGKQGKIKDEAYLDGVQVGDWDKGSSTIGLSGCGIGEFLVLMFSLFAIKANNTLVLLHNAGGDRAQNVYEKVGFYLTRSKEADDEMIVDLAGKKKGQTAGAEWKKRYDAFRKKVGTRLKKCKEFWRDLPPVIAEPSPVSMPGARGTRKRRRRRKKKGGNATRRGMRGGAYGDMTPASVYPAGRTTVREHQEPVRERVTRRAERFADGSPPPPRVTVSDAKSDDDSGKKSDIGLYPVVNVIGPRGRVSLGYTYASPEDREAAEQRGLSVGEYLRDPGQVAVTPSRPRCLPSSRCSLMGGGKRRTKLTRRERRKRRRRNRRRTRR